MEDGVHKSEVSITKTALNPKRNSSVPERTGHVSVLAEKYMIIWGGYNDDYDPFHLAYLPPDILWIYDTEFKVWFVSKSRDAIPIAASGCTACSQEGCMYMFGGHASHGYLNTLYKLDLNSLQWEAVFPVSSSLAPSPRDKAVSWFYENKFYTFGGYGIRDYSRDSMYLEEHNTESFFQHDTSEHSHKGWNNQLCIFNFNTMEWSLAESKGQRPSARAAHSAVRFGGKVYIFGGRHQNIRLNDLHCLDLDTQTWSGCLHVSSEQPEGRSWHTSTAVSSSQMFLYGGFNTNCVPLSDAWLLDIGSLQWTQLSHFPTNQPRLWHTACVTQEKEVIVFGGCDNNILDNEEESQVDHRNDILLFQLQPYSLTRLCMEYVYRHRMQLGGQWDLLPRPFSDWLHRKEELDIQILMSSDSSSDSDNDSTHRSSGQTCVVS
ncbi:kelch domain-containing protein 2-like [Ostrea edulis]|uniref:kelch domain-containing protein 2-like n=1 Tax=Ostrea edulis TaxID=37623 RepID=UPI0024AEAE70|nr:kelch domain-containing protein 2-like [Ostrea edulis]